MKAKLLWLGCIAFFLGIYAQEVADTETADDMILNEQEQQADDAAPADGQDDKAPETAHEIEPSNDDTEHHDDEQQPEPEESDAIVTGQDIIKGPEAENQDKDDEIVQGFLRMPKKEEDQAGAPLMSNERLAFDVDKKRQEVIDLVNRAVKELQDQSLDTACNRFTHTKNFLYGDLYIFVFAADGTCLAHGDNPQLIWKNMIDEVDWVGTPYVKDIIKKAKSGGGWVTYGWNASTKVSYVQLVEKDGKSYIVGSGYFPHSKEEAVVNLVKGGVALFNRVKKDGQPADWAFSRMSYPTGKFVAGNLYLYALDFKGTIAAQGERPGLINSNAWDYQDEKGLYVNQEIIKKLKNTTEGVWVEYVSKRAVKKAYAEKVTAKDGKEYFIACGFYPDANRTATVDLVRKGYQFMKTSGKTNAVEEFSQRRSDDYRYGDLSLVVYDLKGKIIADGSNVDNIGRIMWDEKDEDGHYFIQGMLRRATKEGLWVNAKIKGAFQSTYAQKVDLGVSQYVIACSYYPVSKAETMMLLVQSGASYLQSNPREVAFGEFIKRDGRFRRGDLQLIAIDTQGLCYAYGDDVDLIWRNIIGVNDDAGRPFIKMFINGARQGATVINTKLNNAIKLNYVMPIDKDGKTYIIGSGYYQ